MYIENGVVYAGEKESPIKISGIRPLDNFCLWVRFNTGEAKIFDFKPLLQFPAFAPLLDESMFKSVYIDYGVAVWNDGDIDIAPELLYRDGILVKDTETA